MSTALPVELPREVPEGARWLANKVMSEREQVRRTLARRAMADLGELEEPLGSNRSPMIDLYNKAAGVPVGSFYCASSTAAWWRSAGLATPPLERAWWKQYGLPHLGPASCDGWLKWGLVTGRFVSRPEPGNLMLFGSMQDATHVEMVVRTGPLLLTVGGNSAFRSSTRNGLGFALHEQDVKDSRIVGYVSPWPDSTT
jgi:hypothetical protein